MIDSSSPAVTQTKSAWRRHWNQRTVDPWRAGNVLVNDLDEGWAGDVERAIGDLARFRRRRKPLTRSGFRRTRRFNITGLPGTFVEACIGHPVQNRESCYNHAHRD